MDPPVIGVSLVTGVRTDVTPGVLPGVPVRREYTLLDFTVPCMSVKHLLVDFSF